jgi:hypothetical protein
VTKFNEAFTEATRMPRGSGDTAPGKRMADVRWYLESVGRLIGETGGTLSPTRFYVLDGQVYCVCSQTQAHYCGDYFDFCDRLRGGHFPYFRRAPGFHLGG